MEIQRTPGAWELYCDGEDACTDEAALRAANADVGCTIDVGGSTTWVWWQYGPDDMRLRTEGPGIVDVPDRVYGAQVWDADARPDHDGDGEPDATGQWIVHHINCAGW